MSVAGITCLLLGLVLIAPAAHSDLIAAPDIYVVDGDTIVVENYFQDQCRGNMTVAAVRNRTAAWWVKVLGYRAWDSGPGLDARYQ